MSKIKFNPRFRAEDLFAFYLVFMGATFLFAIPENKGDITGLLIMGLIALTFASVIYCRYHFFPIDRGPMRAETAYTYLKDILHGRFDKKVRKEDFLVLAAVLLTLGFLGVGSYFMFYLCLVGTVLFYISIHFNPKGDLILHWIQRFFNRQKVSDDKPATLARLYRTLARKYHPDYARTLRQKVYYERMMKQINKAYAENDLTTLERLSKHTDIKI